MCHVSGGVLAWRKVQRGRRGCSDNTGRLNGLSISESRPHGGGGLVSVGSGASSGEEAPGRDGLALATLVIPSGKYSDANPTLTYFLTYVNVPDNNLVTICRLRKKNSFFSSVNLVLPLSYLLP